MSDIGRCWVAMSDDDEQTVSGVVLNEPTVVDRLDDGFEWVEYVRADTHAGAVSLSDEQWERVLWWLHKPVPPGPAKDMDAAIIRAITTQRGQ